MSMLNQWALAYLHSTHFHSRKCFRLQANIFGHSNARTVHILKAFEGSIARPFSTRNGTFAPGPSFPPWMPCEDKKSSEFVDYRNNYREEKLWTKRYLMTLLTFSDDEENQFGFKSWKARKVRKNCVFLSIVILKINNPRIFDLMIK